MAVLRMNLKFFLLMICVILLIIPEVPFFEEVVSKTNGNLEVESMNFDLNYVDSAPIVITDNTNFTTLGFPGAGTKSDPYIIEGLKINSTDDCINIKDTTAHFIIRDLLEE